MVSLVLAVIDVHLIDYSGKGKGIKNLTKPKLSIAIILDSYYIKT